MITSAVAPPDLAATLPYLVHASLQLVHAPLHPHAPLPHEGVIHTCGSIWAWISMVMVGVGAPCLGGGLPSLLTLHLQVRALSYLPSRLGQGFWF